MIPEKYIIQIDGSPFVSYAGLLYLARQQQIARLHVFIEQLPTPDNNYVAVMRATAVTRDGRSFADYGDASPKSVGDAQFIPHLIRIASTRAKARVLRDALAIDITSAEELPVCKEKRQHSIRTMKAVTPAQLNILLSQCDQLQIGEKEKQNLCNLSREDASNRIDQYNQMIRASKKNVQMQSS